MPLVTAAVGRFDGTLTTIRAHERSPDGSPNPTYRCLFPEEPAAGTVPTCEQAGILGALTGVLGSLMALEVIREIVGFGEGLVGRRNRPERGPCSVTAPCSAAAPARIRGSCGRACRG